MRKIIYLANPYGFSKQQKGLLLPIANEIESLGYEVWEPFERNVQIDPHNIAIANCKDVANSFAVFAIVNGCPPDEGVMFEIGYATALEKPVFLFRDDFRNCSDSRDYPINLMAFAGIPRGTWEDYLYTNIEQICSPHKALFRFR